MYFEYRKVLNMLNALEQTAITAERKAGRAGEKAKQKVAQYITQCITTPDIQCKIRESGGVMEHILVATEAEEVKKVEMATQVLADITDPDVSVQTFRDKNRARMGQVGKSVRSPVPGDLYILGDREIIVIESRGQGYTRAIESKLKGLMTELTPRDGIQMMKRMKTLIEFKATHHRYGVDKGEVIRHPEGIRLPNQESFRRICQDEVLQIREIATQYLNATDKPLYIMVEQITGGLVPQDSATFICNAFRVPQSVSNVAVITDAVSKFYDVPPNIKALWPNKPMIVTLYLDEDRKLGLFVKIGDE
jgi:hypothetical protein